MRIVNVASEFFRAASRVYEVLSALADLMVKISSANYYCVTMSLDSGDIIARRMLQTCTENLVKSAEAVLLALRPQIGPLKKSLLWMWMQR